MANETVNVELIIEAGKSAKTLGDVKQSVKDVNQALKEVEFGTAEWEKLHEVFLKNRAVIKSMRQEFPGLKQLEGIGKTVTSSFAIATASIELFGSKNEKLNEGLKKTAASLELMLGFKELARSMREAAIANEGVNKSLLTNPYVLLAAVILGVAAALGTTAHKGSEMGDALVELKSRGGNLSPVWEVLKAGAIGFASSIVTGTAAILNFTAAILGIQPKSQAAAEEFERLKANVEGSGEAIKNHSKKLDDDLAIFKSTSDDKAAIIKKEIANEKDKQAFEENYYKQANDLRMMDAEYSKLSEADKKKQDEIRSALYEKHIGYITDLTVKQNELNKVEKEAADAAAKEKEVAALAKMKKGLDDIISSDEHYLQIEKELGATALQENAQAIKNNENEAKHIADKVKMLGDISKRDKEQEAAYQALLELQKKNIEQNEVLIAQGVKLNNDEATKKELANLESYKIGYEGLVKTEEAAYKAKQAAGATETSLSKLREDSFNKEMQYLQTEIATIEASNITEEEKKKKVEEVKLKITELTGNFKVLNAEIAQYNKMHFFTADQQKEINVAETYIGKVQSSISEMGKAATALAQQEADKRIAIYKAENDAEQASLKQRLDMGLLTQAQYDAQKKAADDKLKAEEAQAKKKAFVINKAFSIEQAVISTALAVMNALATPLPFPAPEIFAGLAAATGAVEIGTIAASQPPAMATGGIFNDGGSVAGVGTGTSDSINARLSNGESVINARSTAAFKPLLSAINQIGGGVAFKGVQQGQQGNHPAAASSAPESAAKPQRVYVTEYDITRTQSKVAVIQNRSTF